MVAFRQSKVQDTRRVEEMQVDNSEHLEQGHPAAVETEVDQERLDKPRRASALGSATASTLQELGRRKRVVVK